MSEHPRLGRRGFRDWAELLADLAAIASAPEPFNEVRIRTTGALTIEQADDEVRLLIAGEPVVTFGPGEFRGAWSWRKGDEFYIDLDVGRHPIQIGGRRSSARSVEPLR